jgi:hypothetical protein
MRFWHRSSFGLVLFIGLSACGDDKANVTDAPKAIDAKDIDAPAVTDVDYFSKEGGEVRLEYLTFAAGSPQATRARATSFFYNGVDGDGFHQFPDVPGCTRWQDPPPRWPFTREKTSTFMDVGQVIITGGPQQLNLSPITPVKGACSVTVATQCFVNGDCPTTETCNGATGNKDNLSRQYTGPWKFAGEAPSPLVLNNMGPNFITPDTTYDVILTGSASWPAQIFKDALYMPGAWTPISPAIDVNPVLQAGTPLDVTFQNVVEVNRPAGYPQNTLVHFIALPNTAILSCIIDGTPDTVTVSAADIDYVRTLAPTGGKFVRQHSTHALREMTDGVTHNNKRIDIIGIWCFNYTFTVAP